MTFYDVSVISYHLAGSGSGMETLMSAMEAFESAIKPGNWKNVKGCGECKLTGEYAGGSDMLWHDIAVKAEVILAIESCGKFKWNQTYKIGNDSPHEFLAKKAAENADLWFTVGFSEI